MAEKVTVLNPECIIICAIYECLGLLYDSKYSSEVPYFETFEHFSEFLSVCLQTAAVWIAHGQLLGFLKIFKF